MPFGDWFSRWFRLTQLALPYLIDLVFSMNSLIEIVVPTFPHNKKYLHGFDAIQILSFPRSFEAVFKTPGGSYEQSSFVVLDPAFH